MVERDGQADRGRDPAQARSAGSIVEAEHLYARWRTRQSASAHITSGSTASADTRAPALLAECPKPTSAGRIRTSRIRIGASYYDALDDNDGTLMPFATDCERHENGMVHDSASAGPIAASRPNRFSQPRTHPADLSRRCGPTPSDRAAVSRASSTAPTSDEPPHRLPGHRQCRVPRSSPPIRSTPHRDSRPHGPVALPPPDGLPALYEVTAAAGDDPVHVHHRRPDAKFDPFDLARRAASFSRSAPTARSTRSRRWASSPPLNSPTGWEDAE